MSLAATQPWGFTNLSGWHFRPTIRGVCFPHTPAQQTRRIVEARLEGLEQFTSSLTSEQRTRLMAALADLPHRS